MRRLALLLLLLTGCTSTEPSYILDTIRCWTTDTLGVIRDTCFTAR